MSGEELHLTKKATRVLRAFCEDRDQDLSGRDIGRKLWMLSGTVYPILLKLEDEGWLTSRWEAADVRQHRRRLYRITGVGYQKTQALGRSSWTS